jgi:hypothetical protein
MGTCAPAHAQQMQPAASSQPAPGQLGATPFGIPDGRVTTIDLTTQLLYDSNVARSGQPVAASRGLTQEDQVATPGFDFIVARVVGRDVVFVDGDLGYDFHRVNTVLNREHIDVTAGLNARLGGCQAVPTVEYERHEGDLENLVANHVSNVLQSTTVGVTADCGRANGFAPTGGVSYDWRSNSDAVFQQFDTNTLSVNAGLAYRQPVLGSIALFGSFDEIDFPDAPITNPSEGDTYAYQIVAGGMSYYRHFGNRLSASALLSYTDLEPNSSLTPKFDGITYSLALTYNFTPRLFGHVSASRATTPSLRIGSKYSVDDIYIVDLTYVATKRLSFAIKAYRTSQDYHLDDDAPVTDITRQTIYSVFALVGYKINERLSVLLNAGDEERTANATGLGYSSTRVALAFKATY